MQPIAAVAERRGRAMLGKPRGRMVPAARGPDERVPLQTRLGSAPSALTGASRADMKAAVQVKSLPCRCFVCQVDIL